MLITKGNKDAGYMKMHYTSYSFCESKTVIKNKVYFKPDTKVWKSNKKQRQK